MADEETNRLLAEILQEIRELRRTQSILARTAMAEMKSVLCASYLTTPQRQAMYELADGSRTLSDIAREVGVTKEAVRLLMRDLDQQGYIEMARSGRGSTPRRLVW